MRISRKTLTRRWLWASFLGLGVFAILAMLDLRLKLLTGVGTGDLQKLATAADFRAAFFAWAAQPYAVRVGFALGLGYLLMPLYAAAFFYSGVIVREAFAPEPGRLRRILALAAMVPVVGAALDAGGNALDLWMMLEGATDRLAQFAFEVFNAKWAAVYIGLVLLAGAVLAQVHERKKQVPATRDPAA
jgi:hypothetical protein